MKIQGLQCPECYCIDIYESDDIDEIDICHCEDCGHEGDVAIFQHRISTLVIAFKNTETKTIELENEEIAWIALNKKDGSRELYFKQGSEADND